MAAAPEFKAGEEVIVNGKIGTLDTYDEANSVWKVTVTGGTEDAKVENITRSSEWAAETLKKKLPANLFWRKYLGKDGADAFYINLLTMEKSWSKPENFVDLTEAGDLQAMNEACGQHANSIELIVSQMAEADKPDLNNLKKLVLSGCTSGHVAMMKLFLKQIELDLETPLLREALTEAINAGKEDVVGLIIEDIQERGVEFDVEKPIAFDMLQLASDKANVGIVKVICEHLTSQNDYIDAARGPKIGDILADASKNNRVEIVRQLVKYLDKSNDGNSELLCESIQQAAEADLSDVVSVFLKDYVDGDWLKNHQPVLGKLIMSSAENGRSGVLSVVLAATKRIGESKPVADVKPAADVKKEAATEVKAAEPQQWSCSACTFLNKSDATNCEMCQTVKPPTPEAKPEPEPEKEEEKPKNDIESEVVEIEEVDFKARVFDALAVSAAGKNVAILNILIADIGKLEFSDERSSNLLSVAAVNGAVECVKSLNAQFGKYEPKTEFVEKTMEAAKEKGFEDVVTALKENIRLVLEVDDPESVAAFIKCVEAGESAKVTEYLERVESLVLESFSEAMKNAAVSGHVGVVKAVLTKMGKLPISDENVSAAFGASVKSGDESLVKLFTDAIDEIDFKTIEGGLVECIKTNKYSVINILKEKVGHFELTNEVGLALYGVDAEETDKKKFQSSVKKGEKDTFNAVVSGLKKATLNSDLGGAYQWAMDENKLDIVKVVADNVADFNSENDMVYLGLSAACKHIKKNKSHKDVINYVIDKLDKLDLENQFMGEAFENACKPEQNAYTPSHNQDYPRLKKMLTKCSDIKISTACVWKGMRKAIIEINTPVVKKLLDKMDSIPGDGKTAEAIALASSGGNAKRMVKVVQIIVDKCGAGNLDIFDPKVGEALRQCCDIQKPDLVEHITRGCGQMSIKNNDVFQACLLCVRTDQMTIFEKICSKLNFMNLKYENVGKLIHMACLENRNVALQKIIAKIKEESDYHLDLETVEFAIRDAASKGFLTELQTVIEGELTLDFTRDNLADGLLLATENEHTACAKFLCEKATGSFKLRIPQVKESLEIASKNGDEEIVRAIVAAGKSGEEEFEAEDKEVISSAMQIASTANQNNIVGILVISVGELTGQTSESLIEAAKQGNLGIIKILVGKKKLSLETEGVPEAIKAAAEGNHVDVLNLLVESVGQGNLTSENSLIADSLVVSATNQNVESFRLLLEGCVNKEEPRSLEISTMCIGKSFYHAARAGCTPIVKMVTAHVKSLDAGAEMVTNAIFGSACNGHQEIVEFICKTIGHLDVDNNMVGAAIWYASRKGNVKIVESLIEAVTHDEYGGRKKLPTSNQHLTQAVVDCYDREGENFTEIVRMINSNY